MNYRELFRDRWRAHEVLFAGRHEYPSAGVHRRMVEDFWSDERELVTLGFRGAGKTTVLEEDLVLAACEGAFRFCLIVGSKEERAAEPLAAVMNELAMNEEVRAVYGDLIGGKWTQTRADLANGCVLMAMGRDQDIRGLKLGNSRPDLVVAIDFEDKDTVQTPEGRRGTLRWFLGELLPACDRVRRRVRIQATPMNAESVPMLLIRQSGWPSRIYPVMSLGDDGAYVSAWPEKFPVAQIEADRRAYVRLGEAELWDREYMCSVETEEVRLFRRQDIRVVPRERSWEGCWAMIDPARTKGPKSASTGWAVWSWVRNRLVVWEAGAEMLLPDEIVELAFRLGERWSPIEIGVEEDGLNEWLLQPLRQEGLRRRTFLPIRGVRAPRGKHDFIRGLQPFFRAGEVELAGEHEALVEQLLGFPTGRIDAPNALAYALLGRPGELVYPAFDPLEHLSRGLGALQYPTFLACNAGPGLLSAVLVQYGEGVLRVLADWLVDGPAMDSFEDVAREASIMTARALVVTAGPRHLQPHHNFGLVQAAKSVPMNVRNGGEEAVGRAWLAGEFERRGRWGPNVVVSEEARGVANALAGGYARPAELRSGGESVDNRYRLLMEGLESFCALLALDRQREEDDTGGNWAFDRQGRRYRSAMPGLRMRG